MKPLQYIALFSAVLGLSQCLAIEGLRITVQGTNAVLSWPSVAGETFIFQRRPDWGTSTPWVTLAATLPAASGTNRTKYTHTGGAPRPQSPPPGGRRRPRRAARAGPLCDGGRRIRRRRRRMGARLCHDGAGPGRQPLASGCGCGVAAGAAPERRAAARAAPLPPWPLSVEQQHALRSSVASQDAARFQALSGGGAAPVYSTWGFYRVVRNGVHMAPRPTATLSGLVSIPIEVGGAGTNAVVGINPRSSYLPMDSAEVVRTSSGVWAMNWQTAFGNNGTHQISLEASLANLTTITNSAVALSVSNRVMLVNPWSRIFGNQLWVDADLSTPVATWELDIYDSQDRYVGTFGDSTTDGAISFIWDLHDPEGNFLDDDFFTGELFITSSGAQQHNPTEPDAIVKWVKERDFPIYRMAVAWADFAPNGPAAQINEKQQLVVATAVVDILNAGGLGPYTLSPGNNPHTETAFRMHDKATRDEIVGYLVSQQYRNFYFLGHGSPDFIGSVNPASYLPRADLAGLLGNSYVSGSVTNQTPFRLVFLDGCETGRGNFSMSFGIPPFSTARGCFVATRGIKSRAFIGFTKKTDFNHNQWQSRANTLAAFWSDWVTQRLPLHVAVQNARQAPIYKFHESVVIYGATNIVVNSE